jgi:hypothetical protein
MLTRLGKQESQSACSARLVLTEQTTILLDGRVCRYNQLPTSAVITFAEVDTDRETVLRIHYRSQK